MSPSGLELTRVNLRPKQAAPSFASSWFFFIYREDKEELDEDSTEWEDSSHQDTKNKKNNTIKLQAKGKKHFKVLKREKQSQRRIYTIKL